MKAAIIACGMAMVLLTLKAIGYPPTSEVSIIQKVGLNSTISPGTIWQIDLINHGTGDTDRIFIWKNRRG